MAAENGLSTASRISPIVWVRPPPRRSDPAPWFGSKPRASIARSTRSFVSAETFGSPFTTRETVFEPDPGERSDIPHGGVPTLAGLPVTSVSPSLSRQSAGSRSSEQRIDELSTNLVRIVS